MLVLALDTATPYLVLGLPRLERALRLERRHAEVLWGELEDFLRDAGVGRRDLEGVAVGRGPGSYTGLRVGVAAGLGLARGLGIPVAGVDTLEAVAMRHSGEVTVAHTTRNGLCYSARYRAGGRGAEALEPPRRAKLAELEPGATFSLDQPPSGMALARLGARAIRGGQTGVEPLYL